MPRLDVELAPPSSLAVYMHVGGPLGTLRVVRLGGEEFRGGPWETPQGREYDPVPVGLEGEKSSRDVEIVYSAWFS